ncbi:MAG: hypothetical protein KatS3mg002_0357 [Candidatus Woesearchaeota archaeon]|nr:MAG: hypothetical protein KatS3mg002_0357 [Candidatus Woesearchaeota archaeon]
MVYQNKFVASIKCNGKFLKEFSDVVYIPFNSEYSIFMKNLDARKVVVKVSIDGDDVLNGKFIIIEPNKTFELNGFLNSDNTIRNKFKFIKKTQKISDHRGDRIDDGFIRIEYQFEEHISTYWHTNYYIYPTPIYIYYDNGTISPYINLDYKFNYPYNINADINVSYSSCTYNVSYESSLNKEDNGITVKGSETFEKFSESSVGILSEPNVLIIRLKGEYENKPVQNIIKSREKIECPICGTKSKVGIKYCPECGCYIFDQIF